MIRLVLFAALLVPLFFISAKAIAQTESGWVAALDANANSLNGQLPPVNEPQPGWSPELDLKSSDGTATVPPCSDPTVLATVRDGILTSINQQMPPALSNGQTMARKVAMSTVWVHPTYSNGTVCDTQVQTDMIGTGPEEIEFQPFAADGEVKVFFYDKDDPGNQ